MNELQIIVSAVDNASSTLGNIGGSLDSLADAASLAVDGFMAIAAAATAADTAIVVAAADNQVATVNLNTSIQDNINIANQAAQGQGAFATELDYAKTQMDLATNELNKMTAANTSTGTVTAATTDKINSLNATLEEDRAKLSALSSAHLTAGQTTAEHEAAIVKLKATMQTTEDEIAKLTASTTSSGDASKYSADQIDAQQQKVALLTGKYDELNGRMSLVGASQATISAQFDKAIDSGVNLGFSVDTTSTALNTLESVLGNPTDAMNALSTAEDLARAKNMDLASAANMVVMGMNGMGRGLQTAGIFIKDGLSGMQALDAIQQQVAGHAQAYANTLNGQLAIAWANINKAMVDAGKVQIPWLTDLVKGFNDLMGIMDDFITGQPKATQELTDFLAKVGLGKDQIAQLQAAWNLISEAWTTTVEPALISLWNTLQPYIPFFEQFIVLVGIDAVVGLEALIAGFAKLLDVGIQVIQFFSDSLVESLTAFVNEVKEAVQWVENLINTIAKVGGGVFSSIGNAVGGAVSAVASVIPHFANGGVVNEPTLALIGEAGPEAVVPLSGSSGGNFSQSSGGITVNIGSLMGTDANAARTFANQIATMITRQLKVRTI